MSRCHVRVGGRLAVAAMVTVLAGAGVFAQGKPSQAPDAADLRAMKEKVALATRMLVREGVLASSGHVSMRVPGTNLVLIGPGDVTRDILAADDIVTVDLDSRQIDGKRQQPGETEIHNGIYRARPDVMAVVHTHPVHSVVFSITGKPILPVSVHGAIFADGVPVFENVGHVNTRELGDGLAKALGSRRAVIMKMHGAAVVGRTLEEAFVSSLQLEENAEKQLWAEATGTVQPMTADEAKRCVEQSFGPGSIRKRWQYYLDRENAATRPVAGTRWAKRTCGTRTPILRAPRTSPPSTTSCVGLPRPSCAGRPRARRSSRRPSSTRPTCGCGSAIPAGPIASTFSGLRRGPCDRFWWNGPGPGAPGNGGAGSSGYRR